MRVRHLLSSLCATLALVGGFAVLPTPASATTADLVATSGARLIGSDLEGAGFSVSGAGDVNGDGLADVIVGAPSARDERGAAYVVFGRSDPGPVRLSALGPREGFKITGAETDDKAGTIVAGAGDINADGLGDVLVTAPDAFGLMRQRQPEAKLRADAATYLVYGRPGGDVSLARLGDGGVVFRETGEAGAAGAGDINGDGTADLVLGSTEGEDGGAYVVFGGNLPPSLDSRRLAARGLQLDGAPGDGTLGYSVAGAGDVNGDGLGDVILGAPNSIDQPVAPGAAYVVYGQSSPGRVLLDQLGDRGFRIAGQRLGFLGSSVAGPGDVNGDGLADLLIGAPAYPLDSNDDRLGLGHAFVIFGSRTPQPVQLESLGTQGYGIQGPRLGSAAGRSVSRAGDLNRDGLADMLVGAPGLEDSGASRHAAAYAVYGQRDASPVTLTPDEVLGPAGVQGVAIPGRGADATGYSVSGPGDTTGDGQADLLVGAPGTCGGKRLDFRPGAAYLITDLASQAPGSAPKCGRARARRPVRE